MGYSPQGHKESDTTELLHFLSLVVSDSLRPHGVQPARLLRPWDFPGKNTGVSCHFLLQGIFPIQGSNPRCLCWQVDSSPLSCWRSPDSVLPSLLLSHRASVQVLSLLSFLLDILPATPLFSSPIKSKGTPSCIRQKILVCYQIPSPNFHFPANRVFSKRLLPES